MLVIIEILLTLVILPLAVAMVSSAPTRPRRVLIFLGTAFALFLIDSVVTAKSNDLIGVIAVIGAGVMAVVVAAPTSKDEKKLMETLIEEEGDRPKMKRNVRYPHPEPKAPTPAPASSERPAPAESTSPSPSPSPYIPPLPPGTLIHILKHGFPICRFTDLAPVYWPTGHIWVSWISSDADHANCSDCRDGLEELRETERIETRQRTGKRQGGSSNASS